MKENRYTDLSQTVIERHFNAHYVTAYKPGVSQDISYVASHMSVYTTKRIRYVCGICYIARTRPFEKYTRRQTHNR